MRSAAPRKSTLGLCRCFDGLGVNADCLQCFPAVSAPGAKLFLLNPESFDPDILPVRCIVDKDRLFVVVDTVISQTLMLNLISLSKKLKVQTIYVSVVKGTQSFTHSVKTLFYIGFKQVKPGEQASLCSTKGVLLSLSL